MRFKKKRVGIGSSLQKPLPPNTPETAYPAHPPTKLIIVNVNKDQLHVATHVSAGKTIISVTKKGEARDAR